ncbi:MAG: PKD domain-containing protein [Candidatus Hodarchaeales archaeon]
MVPELSTHEDEPVIFDGSRSYDNVGISNFTWTFEDAGLQVLKGVSPTYVFDTPGCLIRQGSIKSLLWSPTIRGIKDHSALTSR